MFRSLIEWAIIRLKQEITEKIAQDGHKGLKHVVFRNFPKFSSVTTPIIHAFSTSFGSHDGDDATQDLYSEINDLHNVLNF
jgi:hypothetical protein